ncbi:DUF1062 domain-containing protein [Sinorhizobium numidicum]|uniref:DUF1062 domain-containing protein n=1 Tax=Sinorhizobium numidicum TaxID=680248 RepID=A0ABY8D031_9HYPH|nr:DUF1062 domain-containing protein [Sinorhizobium numidicum]WEX76226.1 DUF1062 domain-containing protein [Sinorhizobium numidicum]WEX82885.1 DUF1062 domain-containing protein [Sinorhizobium numidicum]
MCTLLRVRWTIIPRTAPEPRLPCSGCGGPRPFQSSGKIRLNANGRKLDAWLIYKCATCDRTWNRPIFERQNVRDLDQATLQALQSNDPDWIRAQAFDLGALRWKTQTVDETTDVELRKRLLSEEDGWTALRIELAVPLTTSLRLDRLLARELGVSRSKLQEAYEERKLRTDPPHRGILRRRIKDGTHVTIDLSTELEDRSKWRAAVTEGSDRGWLFRK